MDEDSTEPQLREISRMVNQTHTALIEHMEYTQLGFQEHRHTITENRKSVDNLNKAFNAHRAQEDSDRKVLIEQLEKLKPVAEAVQGIEAVARFGDQLKKVSKWMFALFAPIAALLAMVAVFYEYLEHLWKSQ